MSKYTVSYSSPKVKTETETSLVGARQCVVERLFGKGPKAFATIRKDGKIVEYIYPNRIADDEDIVMPVFVSLDVAVKKVRGVTADGTVYRLNAEEMQAAKRIVAMATSHKR